MRARSLKRQREDREVDDLERFIRTFAFTPCWLCGDDGKMEVHHIFGRSGKLRHHHANLFWCCDYCHAEIVPLIPPKAVYRIKKRRWPVWCDDCVAKELSRNKNGRIDI